jgi:hypothetical protein
MSRSLEIQAGRTRRRTRRRRHSGIAILVVLVASFAVASVATAGSRERAKRMHDRLVGVPPSADVLNEMADLIDVDTEVAFRQAAELAMETPAFYNTALKRFVTPWTNAAGDAFAPFNDYTALVIGMVRDDIPFNEVLSADMVYTGASGVVASNYSHSNNDHYEQLDADGIDLSDSALFVQRTQSGLNGSQLVSAETAGIITTRAAGEAFFSAGTNRRMWRFIGMNYLCRDMEDLHDISRPADRIRQDVGRSPGGDSALFANGCTGCHSGMDPLAGAFAYFDFDMEQGRTVYTRGDIQEKYLINRNTFPGGYITIDDRWHNFWRSGPNSALGWNSPASGGFGPKSMGMEVAGSHAFSVCQVEKVFEQVCFREPSSDDDYEKVQEIATIFEEESYGLRRVFAETAVYCTEGE